MYVLGEVDPNFLKEVWTLYAIGMTVILLRFAVRLRAGGLTGLKADDLFALLVLICCTCGYAGVHICYYYGTNAEGAALQAMGVKLTAPQIEQLENGSKFQLGAWYAYFSLVWSLKGTMIMFFKRMTLGLKEQKLVNYVGYACIVTYIAVFLTVSCGCLPYHKNWQVVPDPGSKCTLKPQNFLVMTVLNIVTDAGILYIPMPLLWRLQVKLRKKIVVGVLLSSGIFIIGAAIVRVVFSLSSTPSAVTINRWGVRETFVGIVAVNIPCLRPLLSWTFWMTGQQQNSSHQQSTNTGPSASRGPHGPYEMTSSVNDNTKRADSPSGSEEHIFSKSSDQKSSGLQPESGVVVVQTDYEVTTEARNGEEPGWHGGYVASGKRKGNIV